MSSVAAFSFIVQLPREIMEVFKQLNKEGVTIIQVTHSEKNASYGNRIIELMDGLIKQ